MHNKLGLKLFSDKSFVPKLSHVEVKDGNELNLASVDGLAFSVAPTGSPALQARLNRQKGSLKRRQDGRIDEIQPESEPKPEPESSLEDEPSRVLRDWAWAETSGEFLFGFNNPDPGPDAWEDSAHFQRNAVGNFTDLDWLTCGSDKGLTGQASNFMSYANEYGEIMIPHRWHRALGLEGPCIIVIDKDLLASLKPLYAPVTYLGIRKLCYHPRETHVPFFLGGM